MTRAELDRLPAPRRAGSPVNPWLTGHYEITLEVADQRGAPWTEDDDRYILANPEQPSRELGLVLSRTTVRRVLLGLEYRWRRPKHVLPEDPAARAKMSALFERVTWAPPDAVLLCEDECDVHLVPVLRALWMRRGQQVRILTPGTNRKVAVFGALEPATGGFTYELYRRKGAMEFTHFLDRLLAAYPGRPILLILDNASIHTAKLVAAWLAQHPRLELLFLPSYSGHKHNPVEKVWWRLRDRVAANRLHGSLEALTVAIRTFFAEEFTPEAALRLAA